jgi:subfamily B ATP-binding cassette protein HlyB/CyaB
LAFAFASKRYLARKTFPVHSLPALALPRDGSGGPALILKTDGERILLFRAGTETPQTVTLRDLRPPVCAVPVLHTAPGKTGVATGRRSRRAAACQPIRLRWFVPELLKHKRIWRDVLLASLAIQLIGLATPLFTQAIIDKVVVHQTQGTLVVVGVALVMFMVFSTVMTWLRQYLVIHHRQSHRLGAGSHVFGHMLRLPLRYFEQRPTGVIVSRLHGVENHPGLLSGAP